MVTIELIFSLLLHIENKDLPTSLPREPDSPE